MILALTIILILLAGVAKALQDQEVVKGLNLTSWRFKYASPLEPYIKKWYYFGFYTPKYKERFPFSTTILVFLTDKWHRYDTIRDTLLVSAVCVAFFGISTDALLAIVVLRQAKSLVFHLTYHNLLKN